MVIYFSLTDVFCSADYFEFLVLIFCWVIPKSRRVVGRSSAEITGGVLQIPVCPRLWRIWRRSPGWFVNAYIIISSQVRVFFSLFLFFSREEKNESRTVGVAALHYSVGNWESSDFQCKNQILYYILVY
ncbi:hypothetical protein L873DRAFT_124282 [Choiromyces venosus 120613-1]|uniref:Uncharacterized protein n=1 Tax=Choiromyces venosus 120613-1 TaxID=1336337 RepID=A0A3N4JGC7_9PEZI|nr:hypothetical protein L873DRAFT_124282 [Choiromyces venosus 120613-1]